MTDPLDNLTTAQHHRTMAWIDFIDLLLASIVRLQTHPEELDPITITLRTEGHRLGASFDHTALEMVNRVAGIVGIEQATRAEQIEGLRAEVAELRALAEQGSEP